MCESKIMINGKLTNLEDIKKFCEYQIDSTFGFLCGVKLVTNYEICPYELTNISLGENGLEISLLGNKCKDFKFLK